MNPWQETRNNPEEFAYQGWRQHWLLLWGFIGQQYYNDCMFDGISEELCEVCFQDDAVQQKLRAAIEWVEKEESRECCERAVCGVCAVHAKELP